MLNGLELAAAFRQAQAQKGVTNAKVAKHFGISSPSVSEWRKHGRIGKDKIEGLVQYFLDVVPPEHWGLTLTAPVGKAEQNGSPSEPALHDDLSPMARKSMQQIADAVAHADGALDGTLAWYAQWISRIKDPKHVPGWTDAQSRTKRNLRIIFEGLIGGISDEQAGALAITLGSVMPPVRDAEQEHPNRSAMLKEALLFVQGRGVAMSEKRALTLANELVDQLISEGVKDVAGTRRYIAAAKQKGSARHGKIKIG